jgi:hypothetical protein
MSAIDDAVARIPAPAPPATTTTRQRPWPAASRVALAFVAMQIPLTAIALAFEWRGTWGTPEEHGALLADFLRYGSAVSGPLMPQLILIVLALGARRPGRLGVLAGAGIGVMGLLVTFNGLMDGFADATWAPRAAHVAAAVLFASAGALLTVTGARRALSR